jgi:hypothetical protein
VAALVFVVGGVWVAALGAVCGALPVLESENVRRERLAIRAYKSRFKFRGTPRFPITHWPPLGPFNLIGPTGFLPGNFKIDLRYPDDQQIRHQIGRPEEVDAIGWKAAAELIWKDLRLAALGLVLIAVSVPLTSFGLLT